MFISDASSNTIGGTQPGARNVISGNNQGIRIQNASATGNLVQGNFIGTDVTGTADLGNGANGVLIWIKASNNTIGGTTEEARNIISANAMAGVYISSTAGNNVVQGNYIGTDLNGTAALGNQTGIIIVEAPNNTIGGTMAGEGNLISGNDGVGVAIGGTLANGNLVQGNFIGTDVTGTADLGNSDAGVEVSGARGNAIGGTTAGSGNLISGNDGPGVYISGAGLPGNLVQGNFIGTDVTGTTALGNSGNGVSIAAYNTIVGGTTSGARNAIAFNGGDGVSVLGPFNNAILTNSVFANTGLGIDLDADGVTSNDPGDADTGANNLQNFPVLTSATSGSSITIEGTLNSTPDTVFRLEFFSNTAFDPTGYGEGENFLGSTDVTTDVSGNVSFVATFPDTVSAGQFITSTATDPNNNTSEFSQYAQVTSAVQPAEATIDFDPDTLNLKSRGKVGTSEISIEAYIDGRSLLIITGNTVQWHHLDWAAPGRHGFVNLPTVINGVEWYPEWPDWPDEENRTECFSSIYEDLTPDLPESDIEVELEVTEARHSLSIAQYPSADNNYTLILDFNDNPVGGPVWYECELIATWQTAASMHSKATVTVYIELPEAYDANDIDVSTILLNDVVSAKPKPVAVGDHDSNGISDLMVKFDGALVQELLIAGNEVEVTVSGELFDGTPFEGTDTIRVIEKGKK